MKNLQTVVCTLLTCVALTVGCAKEEIKVIEQPASAAQEMEDYEALQEEAAKEKLPGE